MKNCRLVAFVVFVLAGSCSSNLAAQPLGPSYPFTIANQDTLLAGMLPFATASTPITSRITPLDGHFYLNAGAENQQRIRLFGTELAWGASFMDGAHARTLAKHLHKLGFNAVRLVSNDYNYGLVYSDANSSYNLYQPNIDRLDTLMYELKQQGIYVFLTLHSVHNFVKPENVINSDSGWVYGILRQYYDEQIGVLYRKWAKTLLGHVNPLTGLRLADDPVVASIEIDNEYYSLFFGWRDNLINFKDQANVYPNGAETITFTESRRLDTLYAQYLLHKYGSEGALAAAYSGPPVSAANLIDNGSFEDIASTSWTFNVLNGAQGGTANFAGGVDSQYCLFVHLKGLSASPGYGDAYLTNSTLRLKKDSLYELTFWARVKYSPSAPVLVDTLYVVSYDLPSYSATVAQFVPIDTAWKQYKVQFRGIASDAQDFRVYFGKHLCDLQLDAFSVHRKQEMGLLSGEHIATASVGRLPFGSSNMFPFQRFRDLTLFYDSLEQNFYNGVHQCIRDTIKSQIMVNNVCQTWWGTYLDAYANRSSDYAGGGINHDYAFTRKGFPYSDSTFVCLQNSLVSDMYNGALGTAESYALDGKPFVFSSYLTPYINQQNQEVLPLLASYASMQDWDGIFLTYWASSTVELDTNYTYGTDWYSIAGNGAMLSTLPAASDAFRSFKVTPSSFDLQISHTPENIALTPMSGRFSHPFGVSGYLSPSIGAIYKVRQSFGATTEKQASEYPYNPTTGDTAVKVSETNELSWDGQRKWFTAVAPKFNSAVGYFLGDTVSVGTWSFARTDQNTDEISLCIQPFDTMPIASSSNLFLTVGSRSQNTGWIWDADSTGIGKHWGSGPVRFSAEKIQFFVPCDSARLVVHPLDSSGAATRPAFDGYKLSGQQIFTFTIDQSLRGSPWYWLEMTSAPDAVRGEQAATALSFSLYPNPAADESFVRLECPESGKVRIGVYDDLGRLRAVVLDGELSEGMHTIPISTRELGGGHFSVRVEGCGAVVTSSLNVLR